MVASEKTIEQGMRVVTWLREFFAPCWEHTMDEEFIVSTRIGQGYLQTLGVPISNNDIKNFMLYKKGRFNAHEWSDEDIAYANNWLRDCYREQRLILPQEYTK